jgi:hypothetical protein
MIKFLAESKLRACCRLKDTVEETAAQKRNNTSVVNLAEDLWLYPNEIYSDTDNENLPQLQLMATDGSYIITLQDCSDILTSDSNIRDTYKGAGGIDFLPSGFSRDSPPPNDIRITCDRPEPCINAFTWELVTQLIGLHFSNTHPVPFYGYLRLHKCHCPYQSSTEDKV